MHPYQVCVFLALWPVSLTSNEETRSHLRIGSYRNPVAHYPKRPTLNVGRMENDVVRYLSQALNFTYEVPPLSKSELKAGIGSIRNGTGTGLVGKLMKGEIDLTVAGAMLTEETIAVTDGTYPFAFDVVYIIIPYPTYGRKWLSFTQIFTLQVWGAIGATLVLVFVALCPMNRFFVSSTERVGRCSLMIRMISLVTHQSTSFHFTKFSFRLIWITFALALVVLLNAAKGKLTSELARPTYDYLANSIEDVAQNEQIMPYVFLGSPTEHYIMNSPLPSVRKIRDRLLKHPELLVPLSGKVLEILAQGTNRVLMTSNFVTSELLGREAAKHKQCRFTLAKEPFFARSLNGLLQKNSPFTEAVNQKLIAFHESGLYNEIIERFVPRRIKCRVIEERPSNARVVQRLEMLFGVFILWIVGTVVASVAFVLENAVHKCELMRNSKSPVIRMSE